jgi:3-hydroxyacyl-CoA dehydrogenase/3a,7a,12a-trihydroxy-5b-cholest-24-enoyl-CoA hydratase
MVLAETKKRAGSGGGGATAAAPAAAAAQPTTWDVFIAIRDHLERNPELVAKVGTTYLFKITNPDSAWLLDLKNGKGAVTEGEAAAECTLEISESDFIDMTTGKADAMKLFTTGKLKISGNVMASQKLSFLQKINPEHAMAAVAKARAAGQGPGATAAKASPKGAAAPTIFAALDKRFAEKPDLAKEVQAVLVVKTTDPESVWTIHAAGASPSVTQGATAGASATLTLADADLAALAKGTASARDLYQHGKLRVDGDVSVAHRLGFFKGLA